MDMRQLTDHDAHAYQPVRLRALREHPEAFGASFEEEALLPLDQVAHQLAEPTGKSMTFGTWVDGQLVGVVNLFRFPRRKTQHKANLGGMYIAPEVRGQRVGRRLLDYTLTHARAMDGLEDVTLAVTVGNDIARRLYRAVGFVPYGIEPRYIKLGNQYFDIEWMTLSLGHA